MPNQCSVFFLTKVDTIQSQQVEVDIEPERGVYALDYRHGASVSLLDATEAKRSFGAPLQGVHDLTRKGPQDFGAQLPVVAEQGPQAPRDTRGRLC